MSEALRTRPNTPEELLREQRRNQLSFNLAELAVLSLINPTEMIRKIDSQATTLAIDPELVVAEIPEEELSLSA